MFPKNREPEAKAHRLILYRQCDPRQVGGRVKACGRKEAEATEGRH